MLSLIFVPHSLIVSDPQLDGAPLPARLPLVALLASIGLGLGGMLVSVPAQAQSTAVPTRLAPLMIDPALLGGAPVAPAPAPAALGGVGAATKAAAKKTKPVSPVAENAPITPTTSESTPPRAVAARQQPEPVPTPAPAAPGEPVAPRVPSAPAAPTEPVPARAQTTEPTVASRDRKNAPLASTDTVSPVEPKPMPQALPKEQTELLADAITGRNDLELTATGNAELRRDGALLNADRMVYNIVEDNVDAQGNVIYRDPGQGTTMTGSEANMVMAARAGYIDNVNYEIRQQQRVTQPNQGPWTLNTSPMGTQAGALTAQQVASSPNTLPSYGVAAASTVTQQPGVSPIAAPVTAEKIPLDSSSVAGAENNVLLPGQVPLAKIIETTSHGQASRIYFEGEGRYKAEDATYTTCPAGDSGWYLRATTYHADYEQNSGKASNSLLYFQNVPFFYTPYAFFPLDKGRHSGFLAPSFGSSQLNGFTASMPYYFNLAPNYDATFTPMVYGKRGMSFNTDARYLGNEGKTFMPTFSGRDAFNYLPNDRLSNRDRWSFLSQHQQNFGKYLPGLTGAWDLQGVSDSYYFTDLNNSLAAMSQSYLPRSGQINYAGSTWNTSVLAKGFQTLNFNPSASVSTPYQMLPQVNFSMNRSLLGAAGFGNVRLNELDELEVVRSAGMFDQPTRLDGIVTASSTYFTNPGCPQTSASGCAQPFVSGNRLWAYPQFVTSWQSPGIFVTPKVGVHYTQYNTSAGLMTDSGASNGYRAMDSMATSRTLPILSLDTGMVFDRKTEYFGRSLNQTLEPRLYYLYVPYRNQTNLPLFDTGVADVSYAQMFSENMFTGWDRISNANQVTAALTSRYSMEKTGQQLMSFSLGQRVFFQPQQVNLYSYNTSNNSYGSNDYFAQASGLVAPYTSVNGYAQVSPYAQYNASSNNPTKVNRINRASIGARFQPSRENILNYTYRYQNQDYIPGAATSGPGASAVMQNDINGAWKIWGPWRAVGRYTYSAVQSSQIESLAGLEYDADCWALRAVYHRAMTYSSTQTPFLNTSFFIQLELKGLASVGSNPLQVLRRNIPNYNRVSDAAFMSPVADPYY